MPEGWEWDETLYRGSARYYARGRPPYAPGLVTVLANRLGLDGRGRLLDVGCGPGVLGVALAGRFAAVVGVDPDPSMLVEAERAAAAAGVGNARWVQARAEALPGGLGMFRVATFGQSFHWMERDLVAGIVFGMLEPGGAFVQISDVKEAPADADDLPHPAPPYPAIGELVRAYLGPVRRAGTGVLRHGTPGDEAAVLERAGFVGPERVRVPNGELLTRDADDLVAWVYSRSDSAPHLFDERRDGFERDLRRLLADASPSGRFAERAPDTEVFIWRTS